MFAEINDFLEPITKENLKDLKPGEWIWDDAGITRREHRLSLGDKTVDEHVGFRLIDIIEEKKLVSGGMPFRLSFLDKDGDSRYRWEYFEEGRFYRFKDRIEVLDKFANNSRMLYCTDIDCIYNANGTVCSFANVYICDGKCQTRKEYSAAEVWEEICQIPLDELGYIKEDWRHFETDCHDLYDVYRWFETTYNVSIKDLVAQGLKDKELTESN